MPWRAALRLPTHDGRVLAAALVRPAGCLRGWLPGPKALAGHHLLHPQQPRQPYLNLAAAGSAAHCTPELAAGLLLLRLVPLLQSLPAQHPQLGAVALTLAAALTLGRPESWQRHRCAAPLGDPPLLEGCRELSHPAAAAASAVAGQPQHVRRSGPRCLALPHGCWPPLAAGRPAAAWLTDRQGWLSSPERLQGNGRSPQPAKTCLAAASCG